MVLLMSRPFKHPKTGIFWLRKRVPKDLVALLGHDIRVHGDPLLHQEQFDVVPR